MNDEQEQRLRATLGRRLDSGLDNLEPAVAERLAAARAGALAARSRPRWRSASVGLALAASLVLAALALLRLPASAPPAPALDDFEVLAAEDQLELYEDLEFYQWLRSQPLGEEGEAEAG